MNPFDIQKGARNLLENCLAIQADERVVIVGESGSTSYFEPELCYLVKEEAESMGAHVEIVWANPVKGAESIPLNVTECISKADATIFLSRLGDQIRFTELHDGGRKVMCYTLTREHMAAQFATVDHSKLKRVHELLREALLLSQRYVITDACGTSLHGEIKSSSDRETSAVEEFQVDLFPEMIFAPIKCHKLTGNLVIKKFITSSSTRAYEDSVLLMDSSINATVENSLIVNLEGDEKQIISLREQLKRAAELTGGDPYAINSWHTGINSGTFFHGDPYDDIERWGTVSYGSPRFTHFHGAGNDPGDVAFYLFDASVSFDDELYWQDGRFVFLDRPEIQALLSPAERNVLNSNFRLDIGI